MKAKAIYRWNVIDKHTGEIAGAYSTEGGAKRAASRMAEQFKSPGRYITKRR